MYLDVLWQSQDMRGESVPDNNVMVGGFQETSRFPLGNGDGAAVFRNVPHVDDFIRQPIAAVPPNKIRDPNAWSRVLPDVTNANNIHKHFELLL